MATYGYLINDIYFVFAPSIAVAKENFADTTKLKVDKIKKMNSTSMLSDIYKALYVAAFSYKGTVVYKPKHGTIDRNVIFEKYSSDDGKGSFEHFLHLEEKYPGVFTVTHRLIATHPTAKSPNYKLVFTTHVHLSDAKGGIDISSCVKHLEKIKCNEEVRYLPK